MISLRSVAVLPIRLYQLTLSPDHGLVSVLYPYGACRYYPSCSEYTAQAILKYGIISGIFRGGKRILRCHPFAKSRIDHP